LKLVLCYQYRGADKSLARPERKQAIATEDFDVHISYLFSKFEEYIILYYIILYYIILYYIILYYIILYYIILYRNITRLASKETFYL